VKHPVRYIISFYLLLFTACQKEVNIAPNDLQTLGTSAHDLLAADRYTSLVVEIDYMPGFEPDATSIQQLNTFLNTHINKPGGIRIVPHQVPVSGKTTLSISELVQLEKQYRSSFTIDSTLTVYMLLCDASYSDDENTLAISYWNTSTCLFGKSIAESSGAQEQVSRTNLLTTLLEHEFGHLLGLVNQGSPMQRDHRDAANGAHCDNPECLMYHAIETADNLGRNIPVLDAACLSDLKANGGK
jgi:hypothetical protein